MESQFLLLGGLGSLLMGATLGVFGAGGSILTVPLLVYIFRLPAIQATHYSLFVVGVVSGFGVLRERKAGGAPIGELAWFALPAMGGMYFVRNFVVPSLPTVFALPLFGEVSRDRFILLIFALFMIAASLSMMFVKIHAHGAHRALPWQRCLGLAAVGALVGMATGFVGAGGGFLIVPALVFLARFPVAEATRASLLVIALNSLWGFLISPNSWSTIPWATLWGIALAAFAGMLLGLWFKKRIHADRLKPAFGVFVLVMGGYVLWNSI